MFSWITLQKAGLDLLIEPRTPALENNNMARKIDFHTDFEDKVILIWKLEKPQEIMSCFVFHFVQKIQDFTHVLTLEQKDKRYLSRIY